MASMATMAISIIWPLWQYWHSAIVTIDDARTRIWVSNEAFGPQEDSPWRQLSLTNYFRGENCEYMKKYISFIFFGLFLCIIEVPGGKGKWCRKFFGGAIFLYMRMIYFWDRVIWRTLWKVGHPSHHGQREIKDIMPGRGRSEPHSEWRT